jgi:hypothetical protein
MNSPLTFRDAFDVVHLICSTMPGTRVPWSLTNCGESHDGWLNEAIRVPTCVVCIAAWLAGGPRGLTVTLEEARAFRVTVPNSRWP